MSSTTIPSVASMNETFNNRMRAYASKFATREASSRESTIEAAEVPDNRAPKRKRDDDTSEDEETTEEEAPKAHKIILKINFTNNIILSVNPAPNHPPTQPAPAPEAPASRAPPARVSPTPRAKAQKRARPSRPARSTTTAMPAPPPPPTTTTATTTTKTKHNLRSRRPPSPSPPRIPSTYIGTEKPSAWEPIPLPCALLPDDTEGPKAAWARLFPDLAPFGEYGGKSTGWMERMCWKDGAWRVRGVEEPYVERFLGRGSGGVEVEMGVRWKRG